MPATLAAGHSIAEIVTDVIPPSSAYYSCLRCLPSVIFSLTVCVAYSPLPFGLIITVVINLTPSARSSGTQRTLGRSYSACFHFLGVLCSPRRSLVTLVTLPHLPCAYCNWLLVLTFRLVTHALYAFRVPHIPKQPMRSMRTWFSNPAASSPYCKNLTLLHSVRTRTVITFLH